MDQSQVQKIKTTASVGVLEQLMDPLNKLLREQVETNYQSERVLQLLRLQKADAFYRGIQNLAPQMDANTGNIAWVSYGQPTDQNGLNAGGDRQFDYNPRLTASYGAKYVAVLGQRPFWNVAAEAGDPTSEQDRRGARQVNLLVEMLDGQWNVEMLNMRLFYYLFKSGTTLGRVRPVTDGKKFGTYQVPDIQLVPQQVGADEMGQPIVVPVPTQVGVKTYPKSSIEIDLLDGYTITFPFNVVHKDGSPWIVEEVQRDRGELLAEYPNARTIVGLQAGSSIGGDASSATAAIVRAAAQSQTGTVRANLTNLWNWRRVWLAASQFQVIPDDAERKAALDAFPEGVRITLIESKVVEVVAMDFKRRFSACMPSMADYLFTDGASWGMFGMEDYYNNLLAVTSETLETGIPRFLVNPDYADADALNRGRYSPNRFMSAIPRAGESLANAFQTFPTSDFPQQLPMMFEMIKGTMQDFYGLQPQVFGQMPPNLTLGQARMMLTQGLQQLSTAGQLATHFWEETKTNAVNLYIETVKVNPSHNGESIDLDLIRNSTWNLKGSTGIPSSFGDRKSALQDMLTGGTASPQLVQALQLNDPINFSKVVEYLDMPELQNSTLDQITAIQEHVDQLWSSGPTQGPDGSPQPSVPFDSLVFDPKIAVSIAKQALVKPTGQKRIDSPGYANIRAFLQAAQGAIPPDPGPMKVSGALNLTELPPNQMEAVLKMQGVDVPPAMGEPLATQAHVLEQQQKHHNTLESQSHQQALRPPSPENPGLGAIQ